MITVLVVVTAVILVTPPNVLLIRNRERDLVDAEVEERVTDQLELLLLSGSIQSLDVVTVGNETDILILFNVTVSQNIVMSTTTSFASTLIRIAYTLPSVVFIQVPVFSKLPEMLPSNFILLVSNLSVSRRIEGHLAAMMTVSNKIGYVASSMTEVNAINNFMSFATGVYNRSEAIIILAYATTKQEVLFTMKTLLKLNCDVFISDSYLDIPPELHNVHVLSQIIDSRMHLGRLSISTTAIDWKLTINEIFKDPSIIKNRYYAPTRVNRFSSLVTKSMRVSLQFELAHSNDLLLSSDVTNFVNKTRLKLPHELCFAGTTYKLAIDGRMFCHVCDKNMYSPNASIPCGPCDRGYEPSTDQSKCIMCAGNTYSDESRCMPCLSGSHSVMNKSFCIKCSSQLSENDICETPTSNLMLIVLISASCVLLCTIAALVALYMFRRESIVDDIYGLKSIVAVAEWRTDYLLERFGKLDKISTEEEKEHVRYKAWNALTKSLEEVEPHMQNHITQRDLKNLQDIPIERGIGMRVVGITQKTQDLYGLVDMVWCNTRLGFALTQHVLLCRIITINCKGLCADKYITETSLLLTKLGRIPINVLRLEYDCVVCAFGAPQRKTAPVDVGIHTMLEMSTQYNVSAVYGNALVGIAGCDTFKRFQVLHSPPDLSPALAKLSEKLPCCFIVNHELVIKFQERIEQRVTGNLILRSSLQVTHQLCAFDVGFDLLRVFDLERRDIIDSETSSNFFSGHPITVVDMKRSDPLAEVVKSHPPLAAGQIYGWRCTDGEIEIVPHGSPNTISIESSGMKMSVAAIMGTTDGYSQPPQLLHPRTFIPGAIITESGRE